VYKPIAIDRVAKRVTKESDLEDRFEIKNRDQKIDVEFWENPRKHKKTPHNPDFIDLTGETIGRLTVIGWLGKGSWQCRCLCGRYTGRKAKFIQEVLGGRKPNDVMCSECYALMVLKKREYFKQHGEYPQDSEKLEL
jgi:hypothetical protein